MADRGPGVSEVGHKVRAILPTALLLAALAFLAVFCAFWYWPKGPGLLDFGSFVASGRAASEGKDPFAVYPLTFRVAFPGVGLVVDSPNLNPPISVPFFQVLALLEPYDAHRCWYVASLLVYLVVLGLLIRTYSKQTSALRLAWALSLASLWNTLGLGQIYVPLLLVATLAWLRLGNGQRIIPGLLIGAVVAFKPHFAVWPLLLALAGHWVSGLAALASAAVLSLLPVVLYGPHIYSQWAAAILAYGGLLIPVNCSLTGLAARLGSPQAGIALSALLTVGLAAWVWGRRPDPLCVSGLALAASLLIFPIVWPGYALLLVPVLLSRPWIHTVRLGAVLLTFPEFLVPLFERPQWPVVLAGWVYGWAALLILVGLAWEAWRAPGSACATGARPTRHRDCWR
ncbi:MAG: glycosyltransferase family 87 protein [Anaerolineae bacterium]